jgi:hypothetical protein
LNAASASSKSSHLSDADVVDEDVVEDEAAPTFLSCSGSEGLGVEEEVEV